MASIENWPDVHTAPPSSFSSMTLVEEFKDGYLGYHHRTILAILNLFVAFVPPKLSVA